MEKQAKKPDWSGLEALYDLRNHFALSKKVEPFTHPGFTDEYGTEPDKIYYSVVISEMLKTNDDFKMIFDWQFSKYKTKFKFGNELGFIKYEFKKIKGLIERVLTVNRINENEVYQMAESYLMYIEKLSEQQGIKLTASVPKIEEQHNIKPTAPKSVNYILKNESVIIRLFEEYGSLFLDEKIELWKQRWINGNDILPGIKTENFKVGNSKHLLLTILHEAHFLKLMKVDKIEDYAKRRWGLKYFHSNITKYLNDRNAKPHPEKRKVIEILKSELN